MSEEARQAAYRAELANRNAFQRWLDSLMTPPSQAPAEQVRENFEPILQFITEGPDVGQTDEYKSESDIRFN